MPITVGGKIKRLRDIEDELKIGADKISINNIVLNNSNFITDAAKEFGSQSIVVSIDAILIDGNYFVYMVFPRLRFMSN